MSFTRKITTKRPLASLARHAGMAVAAVLLVAAPALAAGGNWVAQGPGPISPAQVENIVPGNEAVGAIHTVVAHPTDPDVLYVGGVNGGIWRTDNATAAMPTWQRQTDKIASQSIGALEFDPTDDKHKTLVAGIGLFSSFGRSGGQRIGLLRTTNRGNKWKVIDGGGILINKNISGVAPRDETIAVSVDFAVPFTFGNIGVWRSTDDGDSFTQIATGNGAATGLPGGVTHDLASDPTNQSRLYTSVVFADFVGGLNGVYRSDDTGATWTKVSNPAIDAQLISGVTSNVEFSVGQSGEVYVAIANNGRLSGLFRSGNGGASWQTLDLPGTIEDGFFIGIHPGGQASIHLSLQADPSNDQLLYIAGDRQPLFNEASGNPVPGFPNSIGAQNFSGRLFRIDAAAAPGSQSSHMTHSNTDSNSSPHADSREMTFDAAGRLVETDDGGVYARLTPQLNTGDWISLNGDIQTTESHDSVYDTLSDIVFAGNQDNGTPMQNLPEDLVWFLFVGGDGGDVQVDTTTLAPDFSIRYTSAQVIQVLNRSFWDPANNFFGFQFLGLNVLDGGNPIQGQFSTPIELNGTDPTRLVISGANSLYESLDQGDTIREIAPGLVGNGTFSQPLAYGATGNPDIIYVGSGEDVFVRTGPHPAPVTVSATFPGIGSGLAVRDIVVDPDDANHAFVVNSQNVFETTDAGATWTTITDDLVTKAGAVPVFRSIEYLPNVLADDDGDSDSDSDSDAGGDQDDVLVVGATNGAFFAKESKGFMKWKDLGNKLPVVPVFDLDYDPADNVLVAGTLGRGNWKLRPFDDDDDDSDSDSD